MNERIRELAIQVQRTEMPGVLFAHPEFVEKFAQLIVRECSSIAADAEQSKGGMPAKYHVLDYFGVEE